jgi:anti-sigma regulatory factor (Ser/Thr protein kinase)
MIQASHDLFRIRDSSDVGAARRAVDALAGQLGIAEQPSASAQIAATELGTNILRHGKDGYLLLRSLERRSGRALEIVAVDRGRGIADPSDALAGASASSDSLGVGLGAVRRLATSFDLYTDVPSGTVVLGRFGAGRWIDDVGSDGALRSGGVSVAVVPGDLNGDGWAVTHDKVSCWVLVVDGLGHGPLAHQAAQAALAAFTPDDHSDPCHWLHQAHTAMRHTRGGVAALACIEPLQRLVRFVGIGNIQGRIVAGGQSFGLASQPGMLGAEAQLPRLRLLDLPWAPGASLLLWSDGLRSQVTLNPDGTLLTHDPTVVAAALHRDFARGSDDATVVVVQDQIGERWLRMR